MNDRIFVYIESEGPACGAWVDLSDEEQVASKVETLAKGRDTGVSDVEGALARAFYCASADSFDFEGYWKCDEDVTIHDIEPAAAAAWLANGNSWNLREFQDHYRGEYSSFDEYVEEYIESTGILSRIPEDLVRYFDVDAYARDMKHSYWDAPADGGGIHLFEH